MGKNPYDQRICLVVCSVALPRSLWQQNIRLDIKPEGRKGPKGDRFQARRTTEGRKGPKGNHYSMYYMVLCRFDT